jgi:hypothetical protein
MTTEIKTVHSFWIPVRVLEELGRESKRKKTSRNSLAISLIETGLKNEEKEKQEKSPLLQGAPTVGRHGKRQATAGIHSSSVDIVDSMMNESTTLITEEADSSTG